MNKKYVRELMIPLHEYAVVSHNATIQEAIKTLKQAQDRPISMDRLPPRAVLIVDDDKKVIGQMELMDVLKSLEPKYSMLGDISALSRAGVNEELINSLIDNLRFWQGDLIDACRRVRSMKITEIMHPLNESLDEDTPLSDAIHRVVVWQTARSLVTRKGEVIGILRLADLFAEVADCIDETEEI
ncbi:MAG: hypothetical protein DRP46_06750 [Candidatus Zixiibacteriota bacterium]|nr:MAG: hypothetical protein DRP46_06750 [candidate division Zixibacteria bacterium]HDL03904.1 CBS domain-containing protein [candidate division Zixibacteria bacterium]